MKLNLGCGYQKKDGWVRVDVDPGVNPDIIADLTKRLPFDDSSIEEIACEQVLEHLPNFKEFMFEVHRILKEGGIATFSVPAFPCVSSVADPDHCRYFVIETFMHFSNPMWFQPSNFSGKGLFDIVEANILKWKNKNEAVSEAGRYHTELVVTMKKVGKDYWEGKNKPLTYNTMVVNRGEEMFGC